jgi:hypothetical protein
MNRNNVIRNGQFAGNNLLKNFRVGSSETICKETSLILFKKDRDYYN